MSNEITKKEPFAGLTKEHIQEYYAPGATDQEFYQFVEIAKRYNLDPVKREIFFVKRRYKDADDKWQEKGDTVIGYMLYLRTADATGKLDGWSLAFDDDKNPSLVTITVHRKDMSHAIEWTVYRDEVDKRQSTWRSMPRFMLRKVAMAQGFRFAFPNEMGDMPYIPEEVPWGDTSETLDIEPPQTKNTGPTPFPSTPKKPAEQPEEPKKEEKSEYGNPASKPFQALLQHVHSQNANFEWLVEHAHALGEIPHNDLNRLPKEWLRQLAENNYAQIEGRINAAKLWPDRSWKKKEEQKEGIPY